MDRPRIVIVGAGVAGLCCGLRLQELGMRPIVVEAGSQVGGRVVTDLREGFLIDRGFQILLCAYPEPRRWLEVPEDLRIEAGRLRLRAFPPGALLWDGSRFRQVPHPLRHPLAAIGAFTAGTVGLRDALALLPRVWAALFRRPDAPEVVGRSVAETLGRRVRPIFAERFLRSFFGGVFLDRTLGTDLGQLDFTLAMFASGDAAVPSGGMAEIPRSLAAQLDPGTLRLHARVEAIEPGAVRIADGSVERGEAVVVATDARDAATLLPAHADPPRPWQGTVMMALAMEAAEVPDGILRLDGTGEGPVNHGCFISAVAPNYAPPGQGLFYANVVDPTWIAMEDAMLEEAIRRQLTGWFGAGVAGWRRIALVRIPRALPRQHPEDLAAPRPLAIGDRLFRCGDHLADGSLNGAMRSGRLAADAVAAALGPTGGRR